MNDSKSSRRSRSAAQRNKGRRGNSECGIYQRESDGLWCASVSIELGKRKVLYGKTRDGAQGAGAGWVRTGGAPVPLWPTSGGAHQATEVS